MRILWLVLPLVVLAGWLSGPASTSRRIDRSGPAAGRDRPTGRPHRWLTLSGCLGGCGLLGWVLGGPLLVLPSLAVGIWLGRWLAGQETSEQARERRRAEHDLPLAVDLLAACVEAGRDPHQVLDVVAAAVGGQLELRLREVSGRLRLGADPGAEWARLASDRLLADLATTLARAIESGTPVASRLRRLADDLRRVRRTQTRARARSVGVRAAAPLALCFLPAFVLVAVVPTVAGTVSELLG